MLTQAHLRLSATSTGRFAPIRAVHGNRRQVFSVRQVKTHCGHSQPGAMDAVTRKVGSNLQLIAQGRPGRHVFVLLYP